jgi:hypothetical protein
MWFGIIALASIVASLIAGRLLARAVAEQTNPLPVRGPSLEHGVQPDRLAIASAAVRRRTMGNAVHRN